MKYPMLAATLLTTTILAGPARAATVIHTAPIPSGLEGNASICQVVNVGTKPAEVTIEILNVNAGSVVAAKTATIEPGAVDMAALLSTPGADTICRVSGVSTKRAVVTYGQYDTTESRPVMTVSVP